MRQEVGGRSGPRHWAWSLVFMAGAGAAQPLPSGPGPSLPPGSAPPSLSLTAVEPLPSEGNPPAQDLGIRWRPPGVRHVDITAWRRISQPAPDALSLVQDREPVYGARFEMKLPSSRRGFATELKAIGLQLDNGAKIMLRRKDGNPTLYYRQQF